VRDRAYLVFGHGFSHALPIVWAARSGIGKVTYARECTHSYRHSRP
jgi:hypothetical protein